MKLSMIPALRLLTILLQLLLNKKLTHTMETTSHLLLHITHRSANSKTHNKSLRLTQTIPSNRLTNHKQRLTNHKQRRYRRHCSHQTNLPSMTLTMYFKAMKRLGSNNTIRGVSGPFLKRVCSGASHVSITECV